MFIRRFSLFSRLRLSLFTKVIWILGPGEGAKHIYTGCSWKKTPLFRSRKKTPLFFPEKNPPRKNRDFKIKERMQRICLRNPLRGWVRVERLYCLLIWSMCGGEGNIFAATHFAPCNRELRVRGDRIAVFPLKPSLFAQNSSFPTLSTFISDCELEKQEKTGLGKS